MFSTDGLSWPEEIDVLKFSDPKNLSLKKRQPSRKLNPRDTKNSETVPDELELGDFGALVHEDGTITIFSNFGHPPVNLVTAHLFHK